MIILGVSGRPRVNPNLEVYNHDSTYTLIVDGELVGSTTGERFSRIKYDGEISDKAIESLLNYGNVKWEEIDRIAWVGNTYDQVYYAELKDQIQNLFGIESEIVDHHLSHAFASFSTSDFEDETQIFTFDGAGDSHVIEFPEKRDLYTETTLDIYREAINLYKRTTGGLYEAKKINNKLIYFKTLKNYFYCDGSQYSNILGDFYNNSAGTLLSRMNKLEDSVQYKDTHKLAINRESVAGKIMGLAAYGKLTSPRIKFYYDFLNKNFRVGSRNEYECPTIFTFDNFKVTTKWLELALNENLDSKDIAALTQKIFEDKIAEFFKKMPSHFKKDYLCLGGGCALNVLTNSRILEEGLYKDVHVNTAPNDSGLSFGAAASLAYKYDGEFRIPQKNIGCIGIEYSDDDALNAYENFKDELTIQRLNDDDLYETVANELVRNGIIGWHQGRSEFGPRALGNRSIFANPSFDNKDMLNTKVKPREWWRPYAAIVMEEYVHDWFNLAKKDSHYMLFSSTVKEQYRQKLLAVTHEDNTCRVQTVNPELNERAYLLLKKFNEKTKIPCLLNTSFNTKKGEPIVETPKDAMSSFINSKMDLLVINNFVFRKKALDNGTEI